MRMQHDCLRPLYLGMGKLLVSTEAGMQLINTPSTMEAPYKPCCELPRNHLNASGMVGGLIDGKVLFCGGVDPNVGYVSTCWYLTGYSWREHSSHLPDVRAAAAGVVTEEGWWVTGRF